jgi:hypothetical protein
MYCVNPDCPDVQATGQPMEYGNGIVSCPVCDEPLVAELRAAEPIPTRQPADTTPSDGEVVVHRTTSLEELQLIEAALDEAEIPFVRREQHLSGLPFAMGSVAPAPGVEYRIAVAPDAAEAAVELLESLAAPAELPDDRAAQPIEPDTGRTSIVPFVVGVLLALAALLLVSQLLGVFDLS